MNFHALRTKRFYTRASYANICNFILWVRWTLLMNDIHIYLWLRLKISLQVLILTRIVIYSGKRMLRRYFLVSGWNKTLIIILIRLKISILLFLSQIDVILIDQLLNRLLIIHKPLFIPRVFKHFILIRFSWLHHILRIIMIVINSSLVNIPKHKIRLLNSLMKIKIKDSKLHIFLNGIVWIIFKIQRLLSVSFKLSSSIYVLSLILLVLVL